MDKLSRWMVTITIVETWTITWADGATSTVVYGARPSFPLLPAYPVATQGGNDLEAIATDSSQDSAIWQMAASESLGESLGAPTDGVG